MTSPDWWIAISNTNCEARAARGLEERGYEAWWPKRVVEVRVGPKRWRACRLFPAFPGYVFFRALGAAKGLTRIDGIRSVLMWKDDEYFSPMTVANLEIERQRSQWALQPFAPVEDAFSIGGATFVTSGPFEGASGLLKRISGDRLVVEADLFGRKVSLDLSRGQCSAAA